jgi:hypothetical protein
LGETLPKKSFTPTCPAGTTVTGPPIATSTTMTRRMIALRAARGLVPALGTISKVLAMRSSVGSGLSKVNFVSKRDDNAL